MARRTKAEIAARRAAALDLKIRGETWQTIADRCGYPSRGAAQTDIQRYLERQVIENADQMRRIELERLDVLQQEAWAVLKKPHLLVQGGQIVTVTAEDGTVIRLQDDGPVLAAIATLLRIAERRAKLTGIDSPTQIEMPGGVRVELVGVDLGALR